MFDENKRWKWTDLDKEVNDPGMFNLVFGEYENNGVREEENDNVLEEHEDDDGNDEVTNDEDEIPNQ